VSYFFASEILEFGEIATFECKIFVDS